jgi:hypothetical protein
VKAWDLVTGVSPRKVKPKPLITAKEEHISSEQVHIVTDVVLQELQAELYIAAACSS